MKKFFALFLTLTLVLSLCSACGNKSVKNEDDIQADIRANDETFIPGDLVFESFNITNRLTNKKEGSDQVFVSFSAKNENFYYTANAQLNYLLYDNGWYCDSYYSSDELITPLVECTEEIAEAGLNEYGWSKIELLDTSKVFDTEVEYLFSGERPYGNYFGERANITVTCDFSVSTLWSVGCVKEEIGSYSFTLSDQMLGKWEADVSYFDETNTHGTTIIEIQSIEDNMITFSYDIDMTVVGWRAFYDTKNVRAQGTQTCEIEQSYSLAGSVFFQMVFKDGVFDLSVSFTPDAGISSVKMESTGENFGSYVLANDYDHRFQKTS